ncbi:MAG: hypothetical protein ACD_13C00014G0008 [uncultured bacterium]|uniref:Transcriptional regulator, XRE family n=1 Tax=Candidatus Woesebacteria bacterium GW2011_GWA1_40_43 TaxID=1618553 RepID=A0A0G0SIC4_9BACT|nr:MAG: hypothetical protein ACD_13C00014G0008 [uncultured bacterium]KKR51576.1 MAG: hypothetical protein UT88_C0035G0004 [Candidatus Woesebacteria bacterium GW2011_GWD2_40_19]KKR58000.1 MAG: hypothetical protein UT96_C0011G0014 [Candidatus Woesebacteria bacterium GW2011_GWC2_40_30]KKR62091.1 MAG: hypothetical protein UU02_C0049G0005 [Candidatus Woesebacteria bacterium GW2011_GWA1_40_43]HAU65060.1 hypothetical protein [Candidatus Woesebacteria bacterium]
MKTIGQILGNARTNKRYSYQKLEEITKIKSSFIVAIENENWQTLPGFATVLGFVKSISATLDVDEKMAVAVLKRDYPPKKISINPNPDISSKPSWNPKLTFILGVGLVILIILGYLTFQYVKFISPPGIEVVSPIEGQAVDGDFVLVFGSTETDVKITVDNQPVLVDKDGKFSTNIEISPNTTKIVIKAISRSGKETVIERKIEVQNN